MGKNDKQQLLKLWETLSPEARSSLLDFTEYLAHKSVMKPVEGGSLTLEKKQPVNIPRPEAENVINALKRLRTSYFMLNADGLLNEASSLLTQFMVHGRDSVSVIDDLETLFELHFRKYLDHD